MEDFGYLKYEEQSKTGTFIKKGLIIGAVILSLFCFGYITISAYYFVYHEEDGNIKVIKSPKRPIKIVKDKNDSNIIIKNLDKTVYENIVNGKKESLYKEDIKIVQTPANSIVKNTSKSDLIKHSRIIDSDKNKELPPSNKFVAKDQTKVIEDDSEYIEKAGVPINRVQIAALSSRESVKEYWSKLKKEYPKLFSKELKPYVKRVDLGKKGIFYRLQIGNFNNQVDAENFCIEFINKAQKNKVDCIIVE